MLDNTSNDSVLTMTLSKGFTTVISVVDKAFCDDKWSASTSPRRKAVYAYRGETGNNGKKLYLGREILKRMLGRDFLPGETCHYIDGNSLNNTRENLEVKVRKVRSKEGSFTNGDN